MPHSEQHLLVWESKLLVELGDSVVKALQDAGLTALQQGLQFTALGVLAAAVSLPITLVALADYIDSDWAIGCERADKAGKVLAGILLSREQGTRPVTLIGTSIGARLMFSCLEEMVRRHELWEASGKQRASPPRRGRKGGGMGGPCNAAGIIENAVLLGAPVGVSPKRWERVARVVHGRLINGYFKKDGILGLIYRIRRLSVSVAGLQPIASRAVENADLSPALSQHMQYCSRVPEIMALLQLDDCRRYARGARGGGGGTSPEAADACGDGSSGDDGSGSGDNGDGGSSGGGSGDCCIDDSDHYSPELGGGGGSGSGGGGGGASSGGGSSAAA
ncbi:hypothetical protein JKP88DRAFT_207505 [Tribonema minus]|uniref:Uncharacterized protein n=1 Tax=Tribonema minus TaxID=303371 RepID=A0A835Z4D9_9STRA|nr:hypothetical protein JKP88DRAFT_207505 [Tribonema minus]